MDVQRRWVYLEGIFGSSADIQTLLPNEFARRRPQDVPGLGVVLGLGLQVWVYGVTGKEVLQFIQ